jgi:hypothetical protein
LLEGDKLSKKKKDISGYLEEHKSEVESLVREFGQGEAAKKLDISRSTLRDFLYRNNLATKKNETVFNEKLQELASIDDPTRVAMDKLKMENKVLKKENKEYAELFASRQMFIDSIREVTSVPVEISEYEVAHQPDGRPEESCIIPIFDQQYGQQVTKSDTPGDKGEYNTEIFDQRLERWVDAATGIIGKRAKGYNIKELIIPLGGDQVEGDEIFAGQAWQLQITPPEQVWQLSEKMTYALKKIIKFAKEEVGVEYIALYGVDDNHGKVGGKRSGARPSVYSWNWLFQQILFDRLQGEPINEMACEPGGALFFYCAGHEFQLIHGHQIKGWGGIPYYGINKFESKSIRLHNRAYKYLLMGHIHQPAEISNGAAETIVSGDWVGPNNLSGQIVAASRPQQKVIFVSDRWGVSNTERIYFQEADEAFAPTEIYGQR